MAAAKGGEQRAGERQKASKAVAWRHGQQRRGDSSYGQPGRGMAAGSIGWL